MTVIHYNTVAVAAGSEEISRTATVIEDNHQRSLSIVAANADNFGGQGSEAFQNTIAQVNRAYLQCQEAIRAAGTTLMQANDSMTQHDASCAAQY